MEGGCVLWGTRVIVPKKLQDRVLDEFHSNHLGMSEMKCLTQSYIWWPGLDRDIEELAKRYSSCQRVKDTVASVDLARETVATCPSRLCWAFPGKDVSHYSRCLFKWPEVFEMGFYHCQEYHCYVVTCLCFTQSTTTTGISQWSPVCI